MAFRWARSAAVLATVVSAGTLAGTVATGTVAHAADSGYNCPARACFEVATGFSKPYGVAADRTTGKVYVADANDDMLYEVDPATGQKRNVLAEKLDVRYVALAGPGTAYVTSISDDKVYEVNLANGRTTVVTSSIDDPYGLDVTGDGSTAYVASRSSDKLYEVDLRTGAVSTVASNLDAVGVALDDAGNAYVTTLDDDKLYRVEVRTGKTEVVAGDLYDPYEAAVDGAGTVFVTSDGHDKVFAVDPKTGAKKEVASHLVDAGGITLDGNGRLYVTTDYDDKLWGVDYVAVPPVKHSATVDSEGAGEAKPGGFAHPGVKVTNTGKRRIGSERVVVTAGPGSKIAGTKLSWWVNGGQASHECVRSADKMKLTCDQVPLNIDPQVKAKLWVTTKVDDGATHGTDLTATYELGSPLFARGDSEYGVVNR
jgi:DNA-binding beta-propeller fold protein YncE